MKSHSSRRSTKRRVVVDESPSQRRRLNNPDDSCDDQEEEEEEKKTMICTQYVAAAAAAERENVDRGVGVVELIASKVSKERAIVDKLNPGELASLMSKMTRYILLKGLRREPISHKKLAGEVVGKDAPMKTKRITNTLLAGAIKTLREVFGFELLSLEGSNVGSQGKFPNSYADFYYLVSAGELSEDGSHWGVLSGGVLESPTRGVLMFILSAIFCSGAKELPEDEMWRLLRSADPRISRAGGGSGPVESGSVGDPEAVVDRLVAEHYLLKNKCDELDAATGKHTFVFKMGPRAYLDVGIKQLITFIAEVQDKVPDLALADSDDDDDDDDDDDGEEGEGEEAG